MSQNQSFFEQPSHTKQFCTFSLGRAAGQGAVFSHILNTGCSSWAWCYTCEITGTLPPVLIHKNQNKIQFQEANIVYLCILYGFLLNVLHKCKQKLYQAGVSPRWKETHDIILFWAVHLHDKTHQVERMVSCLWIKALFCNLSSLLEVHISIGKVQCHFCHEYEILAYNKIIWLNILEWNKLTIGHCLVGLWFCFLFVSVFKNFYFPCVKSTNCWSICK